ncbi:MAG: flavodoxin [Erysipelotrichaceae bacterium]|nr:flavodoxin [Erysipelotrichaceae bacterium]
MKTLTVFLSMKGETIAPGMKIVNLEKGYTNIAAEYVQAAVGGDLFEIEPVRVYNPDHMKMIYEAKEEFDRDARPEIKGFPEHMDEYDLIFLCFPNWWATMPMPVFTFLEHYDWTGKTIAPLVTSGGSGFANALKDLERMCPGAVIKDGLEILGHEVSASEKIIQEWAAAIAEGE